MTNLKPIATAICLLSNLALIHGGIAAPQDQASAVLCHIVEDIHRQPLARAKLTISGSSLSGPMVAYSDSNGSCRINALPSGDYVMIVEKAGYFPLNSEAYSRGRAPSLKFTMAPPADTDLGEITMVTSRSIEGVVRWQDEEPAAHVLVHALRVRGGKAAFHVGDVLLAPTNDRGEFHLDDLLPGSYVVYAYLQGLSPGDARPRIAKPVFYPNSSVPNIGDAIDVRSIPNISGLLMHIEELAGVTVSGTVRETPEVPKGSRVLLGIYIPGNPAQPFAGTMGVAGSPFTIYDVPRGSYLLIAIAQTQKLRNIQSLTVDTEPVRDVDVSVGRGQEISGRAILVRMENGVDSASASPKVYLKAESEKLQFYGHLERGVGADGAFHLQDAIAGETYLLDAIAPAGTYISNVEQNGRTLPGAPFPVTAGGGEVQITLRTDGGTVAGIIKKVKDEQLPEIVVLAPSNRSKEHLFRVATPLKDGSFKVSDIAPGDYSLFAFDKNENDAYLASEYLDKFGDKGVPLSIKASGSYTRELTIIRVLN